MALVRTLGARVRRLAGSAGKGQDAVGLGLLALQRIDETVREAELSIPETSEEQFRWLLGDAASAYRFAPLYVMKFRGHHTYLRVGLARCVRPP